MGSAAVTELNQDPETVLPILVDQPDLTCTNKPVCGRVESVLTNKPILIASFSELKPLISWNPLLLSLFDQLYTTIEAFSQSSSFIVLYDNNTGGVNITVKRISPYQQQYIVKVIDGSISIVQPHDEKFINHISSEGDICKLDELFFIPDSTVNYEAEDDTPNIPLTQPQGDSTTSIKALGWNDSIKNFLQGKKGVGGVNEVKRLVNIANNEFVPAASGGGGQKYVEFKINLSTYYIGSEDFPVSGLPNYLFVLRDVDGTFIQKFSTLTEVEEGIERILRDIKINELVLRIGINPLEDLESFIEDDTIPEEKIGKFIHTGIVKITTLVRIIELLKINKDTNKERIKNYEEQIAKIYYFLFRKFSITKILDYLEKKLGNEVDPIKKQKLAMCKFIYIKGALVVFGIDGWSDVIKSVDPNIDQDGENSFSEAMFKLVRPQN